MTQTTLAQTLQQAVQAHQGGQLDQAEQLYQQVLRSQPNQSDALHLLGVIAYQRHQHSTALDYIQKAIDQNPDVPTYHHNLANAYRDSGNAELASLHYERAVALKPDYADAWNNYGILCQRANRLDDAERYYRKALSIHPTAQVYSNLGHTLTQLGQLDEAANCYREVIARRANHAEGYSWLGGVLLALSRDEEALKYLHKALEYNPKYADAHNNLGNHFKRQRDYRRAASHYRQAIDSQPDKASYYANLGNIYRETNEPTEALSCYKEALKRDPELAVAKHFIAALENKTPEKASEEYVAKVFDEYADHFDSHLAALEYRTPQILRDMVGEALPGSKNNLRILDLGCGTGLCGPLFSDISSYLAGVDLSPKMVAKTKERGVYDLVTTGDIEEALESTPTPFDLIIAADVFVYIGALERIFQATAERLSPGGWFCFSTEKLSEDSSYVLRSSGRFAHSDDYIISLASKMNFKLHTNQSTTLRLEKNHPITGSLWLYKRV